MNTAIVVLIVGVIVVWLAMQHARRIRSGAPQAVKAMRDRLCDPA